MECVFLKKIIGPKPEVFRALLNEFPISKGGRIKFCISLTLSQNS